MDFIINLLPYIINGLSLGLLFALIALGFMLIVGVMELINLAHGSLFALGAYLAMIVIEPHASWFGSLGQWYLGLPMAARYLLAIVLAPALVAVVGMILEVCMRPTYGKDPLYGLLLTFGAALVLEELIRVIWGSAEQVLPVPKQVMGPFLFGGLIYSKYQFFASGLAMGIVVLVWLFLERTPYGAIIKAGAHDSEMVRTLGINLTRLRRI
jgi:branched-subunit amino acid ABC-type transport system permease component